MPAVWNLRKWLKERGITRASEVRRIVRERTGYELSNQAVCDLLNNPPKMVRIQTSQALCDAFYCCLSDFFEVKPAAAFKSNRQTPGASYPLRQSGDESVKVATPNKTPELLKDKPRVDFASFFPDARQYSVEVSKDSSQWETTDGISHRPGEQKVKK